MQKSIMLVQLNNESHSIADEHFSVVKHHRNQMANALNSPSVSVDGTQGQTNDTDLADLVVGRSVKTRLLEKINEGSFGEIYLGELLSNGQKVIVKLEHQHTRNPQLLNEGSVYRHLEGGPGIPETFWYGMHEPLYNVLVMELLGPSLQDLFMYCDRKFSLKTVLLMIDQMVDIIEFFHKSHYIHRDIKPDNFMVGRGDRLDVVYIIDFGLTKKHTGHKRLGRHHYPIAHPMVGTARYASLHAHLGHEDGYRDDMEALAYVWIYFLKGKLPWQGMNATHRGEKLQKITDLKIHTSVSALCEGIPQEFSLYLNYTRKLNLEDKPNYSEVKEVFSRLAQKEGIEYDREFDWIIKERITGKEIVSRDVREGHYSSS